MWRTFFTCGAWAFPVPSGLYKYKAILKGEKERERPVSYAKFC